MIVPNSRSPFLLKPLVAEYIVPKNMCKYGELFYDCI